MSTNRILLVDDDANVLAGYERSLRRKFSVRTAQSGDRGLSLLEEEGPFSVVVADMQMPGMNGVQFLRKAQDKAPDSVRLMLTGNSDQQTVADAVNQGHVFSFLTKPCAADALESALENAIRQYRLVMAEKELLEQTLNGSVNLLTDILSMVDPDAFGRAEHLRDEVKTVAAWFRSTRKWELELAGMLSQIGFVAIPPSVLAKARGRSIDWRRKGYAHARTGNRSQSSRENSALTTGRGNRPVPEQEFRWNGFSGGFSRGRRNSDRRTYSTRFVRPARR